MSKKHLILTKWVQPYVLLETLKKHYAMVDYTFDGFSKNEFKTKLLKGLEAPNTVGLYMKNVNKFYLFSADSEILLNEIFQFNEGDFYYTDDLQEPFDMIDLGKAEASFIFL